MHRPNGLELSVVSNLNLLAGFAALGPKDHRLAIPPPGLGSEDDNLGSIVFGPALSMDKTPGPVFFWVKFSPLNISL